MASNKVGYKAATDGTGPSPIIWEDCPVLEILENPAVGLYMFDDFLAFDMPTLASNISKGAGIYSYRFYEDTGQSLALESLTNGVLAFDITDDNEEIWLQAGGATAAPFMISDTAGSERKLWFEARFKVSVITDDRIGFFIGLAEEGLAAADTIADAGTLAAKDLIGFFGDEGDGDGLNFVYQKGAGGLVTTISNADTLVADTYVNAGFVYDPDAPTAERIKIYIDGVLQSTYVTGTNIATSTFPDGEELSFLCGAKNANDADATLSVDWWRCAQLRF